MEDLIQFLHRRFEPRRRVSKTTPLTLRRPAVAAMVAIALLSIAPPCVSHASPITYYSDRIAFNKAKPGLPVEGFNAAAGFLGNCYPGSVHCYGFQPTPLFNSSTKNAFFSAHTILPGVTITALLPTGQESQILTVFNDGAVKTGGTKSVGTGNVGDTLVLKFSPGVLAVAADIFACCEDTSPPVPTDWGYFTVSFYNGTRLLDSKTSIFEAAGGFGFFGVSSTVPITSIQILYTSNEAVTGLDNLAFGRAPAPNVVRNGSFENTINTWQNTSCNYMALMAGSTKIPNWTVTSTTINEIVWGKTATCDGHTAAAGTFFLDLTGFRSVVSPNGTVQQTLSNLTISHQYSLSLDAISDHNPPLVSINGSVVALTPSGTVNRGSDIWTMYKGSFLAPSTNPVLKIQNQGIQVGFVDNVSIKAQ